MKRWWNSPFTVTDPRRDEFHHARTQLKPIENLSADLRYMKPSGRLNGFSWFLFATACAVIVSVGIVFISYFNHLHV